MELSGFTKVLSKGIISDLKELNNKLAINENSRLYKMTINYLDIFKMPITHLFGKTPFCSTLGFLPRDFS